MKKSLKKIMYAGLTGFLCLGIVNAFIINHHSDFSGITYVKGLDEMYGNVQPGRVLATNSAWKKIENVEIKNTIAYHAVDSSDQGEPPAAIDEDLQLDLVEVINPKLWSRGLPSTDFSGDLATSGGTIESLNVSLPGKEEISVSFAEMNGNVFQYDYAGEIYSGMLYQVDPKSFMVTLTNGPLEGTRLRFVAEFSNEQIEIGQTLKEEHNLEIGFFGENPKSEIKDDKKLDPSIVEAQMINMDAQV
jgi:hypothetical protein